MIEPGIYRVSGRHSLKMIGVVEVLETNEHHIRCKKQDGNVVYLDRKHANALHWTRLDQSTVYGIDCPSGKCEM